MGAPSRAAGAIKRSRKPQGGPVSPGLSPGPRDQPWLKQSPPAYKVHGAEPAQGRPSAALAGCAAAPDPDASRQSQSWASSSWDEHQSKPYSEALGALTVPPRLPGPLSRLPACASWTCTQGGVACSGSASGRLTDPQLQRQHTATKRLPLHSGSQCPVLRICLCCAEQPSAVTFHCCVVLHRVHTLQGSCPFPPRGAPRPPEPRADGRPHAREPWAGAPWAFT